MSQEQHNDAHEAGGPGEQTPGSGSPEAPTVSEFAARSQSGVGWLGAALLLIVMTAVAAIIGGTAKTAALSLVLILIAALIAIAALTILVSFYMLTPNQAAVRTLFGAYRGTDRGSGLRIGHPLYTSYKISLRTRNFNTTPSKVNDANGNPIHIAAVVVWRVVDTARARFGVDDFDDYVVIQSESAVRQMARAYPYESFDDAEATTLIGEPQQVNRHLQQELQERVDAAGVQILEARVTDLSYAAEVADAMLRRQQAAAIVAGRSKIVEGAVGMVQQSLKTLEEGSGDKEPVHLDQERRAAFAANLLTVIASDSPTNPVVNVGSDTSGT